MKGLKILLVFSFLLLVIGLQASAPPGDIERDVTRIEAKADYVIVPVFDIDVLTMEFVEDYTCLLEGRVDDYSNRFTEPFRMADNLFNIEYNTSEFLRWTVNRPHANKQEPIVFYNIDEGRMLYVNLYSTGNFLHNKYLVFHRYEHTPFSEVLIC